jgi:hypothetical protein
MPVAVPTRVKGGRSGSGGGGGGASATSAGGAGGAEGRREAEKIGRSRVAESAEMGIPQSGLPPAGDGPGFAYLAAAGCGTVIKVF